MNPMKKTFYSILSFIAAAGMVFSILAMPAFADENDWWNFRNSDTNNAVTDRPTPVSDKEAWEKWSIQLGTGYNAAPTPPIIIDGKLYVGSGKKIYELDRETGAVLRESEEMAGSVGYAMNTPLYADGKIFIALERARICAVNISDLSIAWTSDNSGLIKGQTVSPLSYVKIGDTGYVYTGTWTYSDGELICVSTNDENVTDGIKALTWKFDPQVDDLENLTEHNCIAKGFYWAGAYVNENYLAIGTDNGTALGDEIDDVPFYTLNPLTGEIIDACYNLKGPIRSTVVYQDGYLYFSTKQARIYKVSVTEEGMLGEPSSIDLAEFGATSATATAAIYGGRIYLGVSGQGGKFASDGGHAFCVVRDDPVLSQSSYLYNLPVPGYPQAGALLSNYNEDADFDGDGAADGRVYLYFTYNAPPGGIFYTYDTPGQTAPTPLSIEESRIFVPSKTKQEYCISPVIVDYDGTMYYKNDSSYLFAVEINPAALLSMKVLDDLGKEIELDNAFAAKTSEYTGKVSDSVENVTFELEFAEDASATINGAPYNGGSFLLEDEETVFEIVVSKNGKSRTYFVTLNKAGSSAYLSALASTNGNTAPNLPTANVREITPAFDKTITEYAFDWIEVQNSNVNHMMNVFLAAENEGAFVKVWPGENCLTKDNDKNIRSFLDDGSIKSYTPSSRLVYQYRFPVYPVDPLKDVQVTVEVTSEDQSNTETYTLTFNRRVYVEDLLLTPSEADLAVGESAELTAEINPLNATDKTVTWTSSNEAAASVEPVETDDGSIKARVNGLSDGTAVITAAAADKGIIAECTVRVFAHMHDTEWEFIKTDACEPTCTQNGNVEYWTCTVCGRNYADDRGIREYTAEEILLPATGHSLEKSAALEPTCTKAGKTEHWICLECGKLFADEEGTAEISEADTVLEPLGHDWGEWETVKEPACEENGLQQRICSHDPEHVEIEKIPAYGHDWGEWTITREAGCETEGEQTRICLRDEAHTETESIPAAGHDWDEGAEEPSGICEGTTVIRYTCKNDPEHVKTEAVSTEGHVWAAEKTIDVLPTCTTEGQQSLHCELCGAVDPESIEVLPALGHDPVRTEAVEASCTENGNIEYYTCSVCGKHFTDEACTQEIRAADTLIHAYDHDMAFEEEVPASCEENGRTGHYFCERCQKNFADLFGTVEIPEEELVIPASGHSFGEWQASSTVHSRVCANCGALEREEHSFNSEGICTVCQKFVFDDVDTSASYFTHVKWAYSNGYVTGTSPTTFSPNGKCTRAQLVMLLYKMAGSPKVSGEIPFTDVEGSKTKRAVLWALNEGIIVPGERFDPNGTLTRVQIVMMLYKWSGSPAVSGEFPFIDVTGTKTKKAVLWAYQNGITTGSSSNKELFAPNSDCKRYQLTIMLYRYKRKF